MHVYCMQMQCFVILVLYIHKVQSSSRTKHITDGVFVVALVFCVVMPTGVGQKIVESWIIRAKISNNYSTGMPSLKRTFISYIKLI